jgi:serine/threonine protein kinase
MDARTTQSVMMAVTSALMSLQLHGHIHKDVKPHNVLVCQEPDEYFGGMEVTYKLSDFGLAGPAADWSPADGEGTPAFKPPDGHWVMSSDTYSLGKLFLACRSGAAPQPGTLEELRASGVYDRLPDPLREEEWDLLRVCLEENGLRRESPCRLLEVTRYFDVNFF